MNEELEDLEQRKKDESKKRNNNEAGSHDSVLLQWQCSVGGCDFVARSKQIYPIMSDKYTLKVIISF